MKFKVTFLNNLKILEFSISAYIVCLIIMLLLNDYDFSLILNLVFIGLCLPQIFLHFVYLYHNLGRSYTINNLNIIIDHKHSSITIKKTEIGSVKLIKPANLDDGWGLHFNGISCYYYLKVTLKSGEIYYFTNLLDPNIDKVFKDNGYSFYRESGLAWI